MPKFTLKSTNKEDLTVRELEFEHSVETEENHQKLLDMLKSDTEYRDLYINIEYTDGIVSQLYATNNPNYKLESSVVWTTNYWALKLYTDEEDKLHCDFNMGRGLIVCNCEEEFETIEKNLLEVFPFIKGRYKKINWNIYTNFISGYNDDNKE